MKKRWTVPAGMDLGGLAVMILGICRSKQKTMPGARPGTNTNVDPEDQFGTKLERKRALAGPRPVCLDQHRGLLGLVWVPFSVQVRQVGLLGTRFLTKFRSGAPYFWGNSKVLRAT